MATPITLAVDEVRTGSISSGIPIDIKNISTNATGLAAFDFTLNWDGTVIQVNSLTMTTAAMARGFSLTIGSIDNAAGTVTFVGVTTTNYSTADLTLVTLSITAVGNVGDTTTITVTITDLVDNYPRQQITPRTAVNTLVQIRAGTQVPLASLVSIALAPVDPSIALGLTQQFTATGTYDDGSVSNISNLVTWASSNDAIATIQTSGGANPGLATSRAVGTSTITATLGTTHGTVTLTVTRAEERAVTPTSEEEGVTPEPTSEEGEVAPAPASKEEKLATIPSEGKETTSAPSTVPAAPTAPTPPPAPIVTIKLTSWWLIGVIVAGVLLFGLVSYFLGSRRRW